MTPTTASTYLNHPKRLARTPEIVDLRDFNMVHAAPVENDQALLTLRYDPRTGGLFPRTGGAST